MIETLQEFDQGFSVLLVSLALQEETFLVVPKLTLGLDHRELIHLSGILTKVMIDRFMYESISNFDSYFVHLHLQHI